MDVYIMSNRHEKTLNKRLNALFEKDVKNEFKLNIIKGAKDPPHEWMSTITEMSKAKAIELYNHVVIWETIKDTGSPGIILYDRAVPTQDSRIMLHLMAIPFGFKDEKHEDVVLYGKYRDKCKHHSKMYNIKFAGGSFPLHRSNSPAGAFAYFVTPAGANRLLLGLKVLRLPVDDYIKRMTELTLRTLVYHPGIFRYGADVNDVELDHTRNECEHKHDKPWTADRFATSTIIAIGLGLVAGYAVVKLKSKRKAA